MNNLSSYCGLVDAKIRASDKDLPVQNCHTYYGTFVLCLVWVLPSSFTFLWLTKSRGCSSLKDFFLNLGKAFMLVPMTLYGFINHLRNPDDNDTLSEVKS